MDKMCVTCPSTDKMRPLSVSGVIAQDVGPA